MTSTYYKLEIKNRTKTRTKGSKDLRRSGIIPGILYYAGEQNVNISIDKSVLFHAIQSGQRIFEIDQDNNKQYTMIKELQYHPVTDEIIHVDLMRVRRSEKMTIAVPLVLIGESIGVKEGGVLSQSLNQVEISCYPTDVPEKIELNIESLELNSARNVGDLEIDIEDVDVITDPSINIVSVTPPAAEEEVVDEGVDDEMDSDGVETPEETTGGESSDGSSDAKAEDS